MKRDYAVLHQDSSDSSVGSVRLSGELFISLVYRSLNVTPDRRNSRRRFRISDSAEEERGRKGS